MEHLNQSGETIQEKAAREKSEARQRRQLKHREREAEKQRKQQHNSERLVSDGLLVEAVQQHRCLYDKADPKYMDKQHSKRIWRTISACLGIENPLVRFSNLRTTYRRAKERVSSGSAARQCKFSLMNEMRFLDEIPATRPTSGSFSSDNQQPPEVVRQRTRVSSPEISLQLSPGTSEYDGESSAGPKTLLRNIGAASPRRRPQQQDKVRSTDRKEGARNYPNSLMKMFCML